MDWRYAGELKEEELANEATARWLALTRAGPVLHDERVHCQIAEGRLAHLGLQNQLGGGEKRNVDWK